MTSYLNRFKYVFHFRTLNIVQMSRRESSCFLQVKRDYSSSAPKSSQEKEGTVLRRVVGIASLLTGICIGTYIRYFQEPKEARELQERRSILGLDEMGGDFDLVDHKSRRRRSEDYRGEWVLIFFGYTRCGVLCSDELEKIASVVEDFDKEPECPSVIPLFITVDPERDTPPVLSKYVREFSNKLIGLTGSVKEIERVCRAYRIHRMVEYENRKDYRIRHSIVIYLVSPQWEIEDSYERETSEVAMKSNILMTMREYGVFESKQKKEKMKIE